MSDPRRIVLKLSGEAFADPAIGYGIDPATVQRIAAEVSEAHALGVEIAVVVGGGNIFRGINSTSTGMTRAHADYMGMLATMINAMALQDALEKAGLQTRVLSALDIKQVAEPYIRRRAVRHLEKGRVVIFGGGTGNPYFTTDTTAALRAAEIGAEAVLKATRVDGVYDADPAKVASARRFETLSYMEALSRRLEIMDSTALSLCMDNNLPIIVFDLRAPNSIARAASGEKIGTLVAQQETALAPGGEA